MPGGMRKYGRNISACKRYKDIGKRFKHKSKKVKQSNGEKASKKYENMYLLKGNCSGIRF